MRKVTFLALALSLAGCESPEAPGEDVPVSQSTGVEAAPFALTSMQQTGRVIFETMCWTCHGLAGRGDGPAVVAGSIPPPPSFHSEDYAQASAESLERRFRSGVEGADPGHPHMQYVASLLRPESFAAALSFVPALSYPAEIPGSALAGQALYERLRCVACHGEHGRGDGTASASLILVSPADFRTDTLLAARDWEGVFERIREGGRPVHGSSMPPWGVFLGEAEMWDLVAYLATFQPGLLRDPPWID